MTSGEANKILIVDDEPDAREALGEFLEANGYKVTTAENGEEALRKIEEQIGLVLLDLSMPVMDGKAFLASGRARGVLRNIPVIITTANPSRTVEGATAVLSKPIAPQKLLHVVRQYMQ